MKSSRPSPLARELAGLYRLRTDSARVAAGIFDAVTVPAGVTLTEQGAPARQVVLVLDGTVEVVRDGAVVAVLSAGDVLGEISVLGAAPAQTATAITTTPCRLAVATADRLGRLRDCTQLYIRLQHLASKRTVPA